MEFHYLWGAFDCGMSWEFVTCLVGGILEGAVWKDSMWSLGSGCCCPLSLSFMMVSFKMLRVGYLEWCVVLNKWPLSDMSDP